MEYQSFLITGGCGLQGSSIVETLRSRYPSCRNIAVLTRDPSLNLFPGVAYHRGDLTSPADIDRCLQACRPTVIFHCAAVVTGTRKPVSDEVVNAINVGGTQLLLAACARLGGVRAFVFTSSVAVVQRPGVEIRGANETWPLIDFVNDRETLVYPKSKAEAETLVLAADGADGEGKGEGREGGCSMRTCAVRPSAVYGERDNDVTPLVMRTAKTMRGLQIGDNKNPMATTYVGNSTHAHLLAAERLLDPDPAVRDAVGGQAFFVANEGASTFWDLARTIWFHAGAGPDPRDPAEYRPEDLRVVSVGLAMWAAWASEWWAWLWGSTPRISRIAVGIVTMTRVYDISKAKRVLGYSEQVGWEEGCRRAARWWVENRGEDKKTK
ncbi:hypothetical protein BKA67DRAFT_661085 [Truncatella angustata]|uniref:3-beta hydroxysteroid dehydrogenase/isomerase domain-containing protein n=1 Tax=Truncatella angustata TaxID=152316 RepID=A0A9P8UHT4_9PEZI|nr:uncharacterized protein BKA67DRAFT_661085 [Truncatella angustata]KAH6652339.1 hypothetical protein BKA67DRAFT_661085 [Truncatella angustata]